MLRSPGQFDITNGSSSVLLSNGTGIPESRIVTSKDVSNTVYKLHVSDPNAAPISAGLP